jgi:hypothetical protein
VVYCYLRELGLQVSTAEGFGAEGCLIVSPSGRACSTPIGSGRRTRRTSWTLIAWSGFRSGCGRAWGTG